MDEAGVETAAVIEEAVLEQYAAFSRFNSPYAAHDRGRAIDLYPAGGAPSPVAGEVVRTHQVQAPDRPHAADHDHLIVVDAGEHLARILHVDPAVEAGDRIDVGDHLGTLVRSGYFAPWVDDHLHLGFRPRNADPVRASGSLPIEVAVDVKPVAWDGTGTVVERGETYVVLDAPGHPSPGGRFAGIAADGSVRAGGGVEGALDGGLPHYDGGGLVGGSESGGGSRSVSMFDVPVGVADAGAISWHDVEVLVDGTPVTGLSLACYRDELGAKLVSWDGVPAAVGERVEVEVRPTRSGPD